MIFDLYDIMILIFYDVVNDNLLHFSNLKLCYKKNMFCLLIMPTFRIKLL